MQENETPEAFSPTEVGLRVGDQGVAAGKLQKYLARFGYLSLDASGEERLRTEPQTTTFDKETSEALRAYQAFHGLPVSGRLDDLTVGQMAVPRCGRRDIWKAEDLRFGQQRFVVTGTRWNTWNLRYGFTNYSADSTRIRINRAVAAAFRTWSEVTSFTFQRVPAILQDTEIRIQFAAGSHGDGANNDFDGPSGVIAHAFNPPANGSAGGQLAGDIHFDEAETWSTAAVVAANSFDLQSVALHEIGHALGLEHSSEPGAVMWPSIPRETPLRTLHQDDIDGIREVYGQQVRVPHVEGLRPAIAARLIRDAGLVAVFSGPTGQNAYVWRQSPRGGQLADLGSDVSMQLRDGAIP